MAATLLGLACPCAIDSSLAAMSSAACRLGLGLGSGFRVRVRVRVGLRLGLERESSAACRCWPSASSRSTMTLVRVSVSSRCSAGDPLSGAARAASMLGGGPPVKTISSLGDLGRSPAEIAAASAIRRSASCMPPPLSSAPRSCPSCTASCRLSAAFSACSPARREPRAAAALGSSARVLFPGAPSSSLEHMDCAVGERGEIGPSRRSSPIQAPPIRGWKPGSW